MGHIHTYNEGNVIDRSLQALLDQTYPVEEVLLVDNASTDNTLRRPFPEIVKIVRFHENRLTSAPIKTAMQYAMDHQYDWVWILNGDSAPRKDALEQLMELYGGFNGELQRAAWLLAALPVDVTTGKCVHGFLVTSKGLQEIRPDGGKPYYECDATIWSGSLYKIAAIRNTGLPREDYAMDMAEFEYGYRGKCHGYRAFVHQGSIIDHNIGGPSLQAVDHRLGPFRIRMIELKPFRCYYIVRNVLYFWLYDFRGQNVMTYAYCILKVAKLMMSFVLRPVTHWTQITACLRGLRDGILKNMHYRYPVNT